MKKLLALALLAVGVFTFAACTPEHQDEVNQARDALVVSGLDDITGDMWVPASGRNNTSISWETDQPDYITVTDDTRVNDAGTEEVRLEVTRPEYGDGDLDVDLTATVTRGDAEAERVFEGVIREEGPPLEVIEDFEVLFDDTELNERVAVEGVVIARMPGNTYIYDGEYALSIYGVDYDLGDEIRVTGYYDRWQTLYQIGDVEDVEVLSTGNDYDVEPIESSIEEINELDFDDPRVHGLPYEVEGILRNDHPQGEVLTSVESDEFIMFTFSQASEADDILFTEEGHLNEYVRMTVHVNARITDGVLHFIDPDNYSLEVLELDEEELLELDIEDIEADDYVLRGEDIELPELGPRGTDFENWTSDDTSLVEDDGTFVDFPAEATSVTFTADAVYEGDETYEDTVEIEVVALPETALSVSDALAEEDGEEVFVEGIVMGHDYHFEPLGVFIQDTETDDAIYVRAFDESFEDVEAGNLIKVYGETDRYTDWGNNQRQIGSPSILVSSDDEDHDFDTITDMDQLDILNGFNEYDEDQLEGSLVGSKHYRLEDIDLVDVDGSFDDHGEVFFELAEDPDAPFDYGFTLDVELAPGLEEEDFEDGMTLEYIEFIPQRVHFDNYRIVVTDLEIE